MIAVTPQPAAWPAPLDVPAALPRDLAGCFVGEALHLSAGESLPGLLPDEVFAAQRSAADTIDARTPATVVAEDHLLPRLGEVVDKYRIDAELGRGGFAVVYRATHLLMRTQVALKILFPWMLRRNPQLAEALCEEARLISLIDHPNVVRVLDVTSSERFTYIIMEYIDGLGLGRALQRKPLTVANAIKVGIHLCQGLQAAHSQGLIHRDIKPGNILVARSGQAKLVDFGLARRADAAAGGNAAGMPSAVAGTPAYMAPEQATDPEHADHRADIYSLGATLFHAATGRMPFPMAEPMQMIMAHLHTPPPDPRSLRPELPAAFAALLGRMLAKRPDDRPADYEALAADMLAIYRSVQPQVTRQLPPVPATPDTGAIAKGALLGKLRSLFQS